MPAAVTDSVPLDFFPQLAETHCLQPWDHGSFVQTCDIADGVNISHVFRRAAFTKKLELSQLRGLRVD